MDILIFTILLSTGNIVNGILPEIQQNIIRIMETKSVSINGQLTSLTELYGNIPSTSTALINPGQEIINTILAGDVVQLGQPLSSDFEKNCPGGQYVQREFTLMSTKNIPTTTLTQSTIKDTPTILAQQIVDNINDEIKTTLLIAIAGDVGAGKSVAIAKIQYEIMQRIPPVAWLIPINIAKLHNSKKLSSITYHDIITSSVDQNHRQLFLNLLKLNPKKIVFLIDGIDHAIGTEWLNEIKNVYSIIKNMLRKGSTVVLSGRLNLMGPLAHLQPIIYIIPEMDIYQIKQYFENIWQIAINQANQPNLELTDSQKQRLQDYIMAFTENLNQTPLPHTPLILSVLAQKFTTIATSTSYKNFNKYDIDCINYVLKELMPRSKLFNALKNAPFTEIVFFNSYLKTTFDYQHYITIPIGRKIYGLIALKLIVGEELLLKNEELRMNLADATKVVLRGKERFRFINIVDGEVKFIHPEYQRFYAALYSIRLMNNENLPIELLTTILKDERYIEIARLMYSGIFFTNIPRVEATMLKMLVTNDNIDTVLLDNLLRYGSDQLCYDSFILLNKVVPSKLQAYFIQAGSYALGVERFLGMLPTVESKLEASSSLSSTSSSQTKTVKYRIELLFARNMMLSLQFVNHGPGSAIYLDHYRYEHLFETIITQSLPKVKLLKLLISWKPDKYFLDENTVNGFLFKTIDQVGDGCEEIADILVQFGASTNYINKDGRTLLDAAEKWKSEKLLRYVTEQLNVPMRNSMIAGPSPSKKKKLTYSGYDNRLEDISSCLGRRSRERRSTATKLTCYISWKDIDQFNDASNQRSIKQIFINSEKYLNSIATAEYINTLKAQQLLQLGNYLENQQVNQKFITGKSIMLTKDVLRYGGLSNYRRHQLINSVVNDLYYPTLQLKSNVRILFSSRTIALWGAASLPLIRSLHSTIATCNLQNNTDNCLYASSILAASAALGPIAATAIKFTPWLIDKFSKTALDILPSIAPKLMRDNIELLHYYGLKYGAGPVALGITAVGIGFDLYNIVEMSRMINQCTQEGTNCLSKDKIDYIISLSFSCISIVAEVGIFIYGLLIATSTLFIPGLLLAVSLMTLQSIATGLNDVIYYDNMYHTTFDEKFRIFFHKIAFLELPADVAALKQRTDWLNILQKRMSELLEYGPDNVVAYAMGIGNFEDDQVRSGTSFIDMNNASSLNTHNLSRIVLQKNNNTLLLCYPQRDTKAAYKDLSNVVHNDAVYKCRNAFVLARQKKWKNQVNNESYIIYNLELIDSGIIRGSHELNNLFLINKGTTELHIIAGSGSTINTCLFRDDLFRGIIIFDEQTRKNNLDFSTVNSTVLHFIWQGKLKTGRIQFDNNIDNVFYIKASSSLPNLHIIGRSTKPDIYQCDYATAEGQRAITIDGAGGESLTNMDIITDCSHSILYPFTRLVGNKKSRQISYTTYVQLGIIPFNNNKIGYAVIQPQTSQFAVNFNKHPLFASLHELVYLPKNQTLVWTLTHGDSSILILSIEPYINAANNSTTRENSSVANPTVTSIFIDSYFNITIFPLIDITANLTERIHVQEFNIFGTVNSTQIDEVLANYQDINAMIYQEFDVVIKLTNLITKQTYVFGSSKSNRLLIETTSMLLFGGNGNDIYVLTKNSSDYLWIINEANDNALDTLLIADNTCSELSVKKVIDTFDLRLICQVRQTTRTINVILRDYLLETSYQHLQIYWRDATYVLLPQEWTNTHDLWDNDNVNFALLFSYGEQWHNAALTLTSDDKYVLLNGTVEANNLTAYRLQDNVILAQKYFDQRHSSFIVLQNFFINNTEFINPKWSKLKIFVVDHFNANDNTLNMVLGIDDIDALIEPTAQFVDGKQGEDFIQEYYVNVTDETHDAKIIEHNNGAVLHGDKLGILKVFGAEPGEFHATVNHDDNSLLLCAHQFCVNIKNWCLSIRHRLQRIEFINLLTHQPIVIQHIDQFDCQQQSNDTINQTGIVKLNNEFIKAQKYLQLIDDNDDNDINRLIRCIGTVFAENVVHEYMFRVFGFTSLIEQMDFMIQNCNELFLPINIKQLNLMLVKLQWDKTIRKFELIEAVMNNKEIQLLRKSIDDLDGVCWEKFIAYCLNIFSKTIKLNNKIAPIDILHNGARILSTCIGETSAVQL